MTPSLPPAPPAILAAAPNLASGRATPPRPSAAESTPQLAAVRRFYEAFARHDGKAMSTIYAPDCTFQDPVFTDLKGPQVGAMWRMLTARGGDLRVSLEEAEAIPGGVRARWIAHYTFSATGQKVVNEVRSTFGFEGGQVSQQWDRFDLQAWMRQAFGPFGWAWGGTAWMQGVVRGQAMKALAEHMKAETSAR